MTHSILLTTAQMVAAEQATISGGTASIELMERAGAAVAQSITAQNSPAKASIVCGQGNNGGDGFVVARILAQAGWTVELGLVGSRADLSGDAAVVAEKFESGGGTIKGVEPSLFEGTAVIIDALFGTGLSRPIEGDAAKAVERMNGCPAPKVAIDIPSGVNADTGLVQGPAVQAVKTITFFRRKPGHVLFPGRFLSGGVEVADIGISDEVLASIRPKFAVNDPQIWGNAFRRPNFLSHKYSRGAVAVFSGHRFETGAARLSAIGALRIGAGLVTIASPSNAADENAAHSTAVMVRRIDTPEHVAAFLGDPRFKAAVIGPGAGVSAETAAKVLTILKSSSSAVLDADALTSFESSATPLFDALRAEDIITPHGGEFGRLFTGLIETPDARLSATIAASEKTGAVVVLKGADTVIAAPDGRAAVNVNAPPDLATAGSGDVLAGFIAGLKAQGMSAFEAACCGVWVHGACGQAAGPGLISEDLPDAVPSVLRSLLSPPPAPQAQS